jgi:biotin transport system substrate-specific component
MTTASSTFATTLSGATLLETLLGRRTDALVARVAAVLALTAATALAAQVSIPLTPVPFTLQPMVVLIGGAALGARLGASSQVLYLMLGILGLPIFAASPFLPQGAARLLGPTAGFLLAYPLAAYLTGWLAERGFDRRYRTSLVAMLAGMTVYFIGGTLRLAYVPPALGLETALQTAVAPFLLADLLKLAIGAAILPAIWRLVGRPRTATTS